MKKKPLAALTAASITVLSVLGTAGTARAELVFLDLTQAIPTFAPLQDDPTKPDLSKPVGNSAPISGFYPQAILYPPDIWATNEGHFASAAILVQEHNGTSFNSPNHYINNARSRETGAIPEQDRKSSDALTMDQLSGKIVLIDMQGQVVAQLERVLLAAFL